MAALVWDATDAGVPCREMVTGLLSGDHCGVLRVTVSRTMVVWCEGPFLFQRIRNLVDCFRKHDDEYMMVEAELHSEH